MPVITEKNKEEVLKAVQSAGVVGMGGGGFPAHVKFNATVDTVVANGAECEPLLWSDKSILLNKPDDVIEGMVLAMELTGASKGVMAVKGKNADVVTAMESAIRRNSSAAHGSIQLALLPNTYPMGDEFVLVEQVLGRTIPEMGLPLNVGAVVSNVATLEALAGVVRRSEPVTSRIVTVVGEVRNPLTVEVPIGTSFNYLVDIAGGTSLSTPHFVDGGPMMGVHTVDGEETVKKTTSGLLVLPEDHPVVKRHLTDSSSRLRMAQAACCLCNECTQVCPRNALGHRIYPDRLMRSVAAGVVHDLQSYTGAYYCCECGLCTVYGCPMYLDPCGMNIEIKQRLREAGVKPPAADEAVPSPFFSTKQVPINRLMSRLQVSGYSVRCPHIGRAEDPEVVVLYLRQGAGAPPKSVVKKGMKVCKGDLVAEPDGYVSAGLHASIDGVVQAVDEEKIVIRLESAPRAEKAQHKPLRIRE